MKLALEFTRGCIRFYRILLEPPSAPDIPAPIDWTDGNP